MFFLFILFRWAMNEARGCIAAALLEPATSYRRNHILYRDHYTTPPRSHAKKNQIARNKLKSIKRGKTRLSNICIEEKNNNNKTKIYICTHYRPHMVFLCRHEQHEDIDVFLLYIAKLSRIDYSLDLIFSQPLFVSVCICVCCVPAEVSVFICRENGRIIRTNVAHATPTPYSIPTISSEEQQQNRNEICISFTGIGTFVELLY